MEMNDRPGHPHHEYPEVKGPLSKNRRRKEEKDMLVMQIAKHSPESCPAFMDKYKMATLNWFENAEKNCAKFGVKMVGFWSDHPTHTVYMLFDTPSMEAMIGLSMTPETQSMMAFQTIKTFPVFDFKQTWDMIKNAK